MHAAAVVFLIRITVTFLKITRCAGVLHVSGTGLVAGLFRQIIAGGLLFRLVLAGHRLLCTGACCLITIIHLLKNLLFNQVVATSGFEPLTSRL